MKTQEEIEKLAEQYLQKHKDDFDNWKEMAHSKITYVDAYNQSQEDMAKEIESLKEQIVLKDVAYSELGNKYSHLLLKLNKQD